MLTLTLPHDQGDRLKPLYQAVAESFSYVRSGASWQSLKDRLGYVGDIRALECTVGENGWHPHIHVLLLMARELSEAEVAELRAFVYRRWCDRITRYGYRAPSWEHGVNVTVSHRDDYLAKMGLSDFADELTKGHTKRCATGHRTPFQVLADLRTVGEAADLDLWREWVEAMHGSRQLTWSRGLRARYLAETEKSDAEIVADNDGEAEESIALIPALVWRSIVRADPDDAWRILDVAEAGGESAVLRWLDRKWLDLAGTARCVARNQASATTDNARARARQ